MCWGCAGGLCHFFVFSLICRRHFKKEVPPPGLHWAQHVLPPLPSALPSLADSTPNPKQAPTQIPNNSTHALAPTHS